MDMGERLVLLIFAGICLYLAYLCFRPLLGLRKNNNDGSEKKQRENNIEIIEPEESEEERQFRVYGDCYGYSYYGDDDK